MKKTTVYHSPMLRYAALKVPEINYINPDFKAKGYNKDNFGPVKVPADSLFFNER